MISQGQNKPYKLVNLSALYFTKGKTNHKKNPSKLSAGPKCLS